MIEHFQAILGRGRPEGRHALGDLAPNRRPAEDRPLTEASEPGRETVTPIEQRGEHDSGSSESGAEQHAAEPLLHDLVCDPLSRALARPGPTCAAPSEANALPPALLPEIEQLLGRLVRRAAFGGDGRKATARLEIGAGALAGATLWVHADAGELTIDLELPPGSSAGDWCERIGARLSARGLSVREITVR